MLEWELVWRGLTSLCTFYTVSAFIQALMSKAILSRTKIYILWRRKKFVLWRRNEIYFFFNFSLCLFSVLTLLSVLKIILLMTGRKMHHSCRTRKTLILQNCLILQKLSDLKYTARLGKPGVARHGSTIWRRTSKHVLLDEW